MKKILIAEDDTFLANAYRVKFSKEGFDIVLVDDGEKVIESLKNSIPDLIILDLVMPVKDGFSTLEEIRKNPEYANIPIVIASNLGQQEDIDRVMKLGATEFIIKSDLQLNEIIEKIKKLLRMN